MKETERKLYTLYTSQKYFNALKVLAYENRTSIAQIINDLVGKYIQENKDFLAKKEIYIDE